MKERPILFISEMVRAILDGRKSQTRRLKGLEKINLEKNMFNYHPVQCSYDKSWIFWSPRNVTKTDNDLAYPKGGGFKCPYGNTGDRLWVREAFFLNYSDDIKVAYKSDWFGRIFGRITELSSTPKWKPSIYMPRSASRITLEVLDITPERLYNISLKDIQAEGLPTSNDFDEDEYRGHFQELWDSINSKKGYGWNENPWVWVISFKRI
jgi:hypothetical protein